MSSKSCDLSTGIQHSKVLDTKSMAESGPSIPALSLTVPSLVDESDDEKENMSHTSKSAHTLNCPRCNQEFPADKHGDLLEHIEMCCDWNVIVIQNKLPGIFSFSEWSKEEYIQYLSYKDWHAVFLAHLTYWLKILRWTYQKKKTFISMYFNVCKHSYGI